MKFGTPLTLFLMVFIILKLAGITKIALWSWWLVFIPMWIGIAAFLIAIIIMGIAAVLANKGVS